MRLLSLLHRLVVAFQLLGHGSSCRGLKQALRRVLLQAGENRTHAIDPLWPDAADVFVERAVVRQRWPRGEEFEEIGREQMCPRHGGILGVEGGCVRVRARRRRRRRYSAVNMV